MIFSTKALIYTAIGAVIGLLFYGLFKMMEMSVVGLVIMGLFAIIGFSIGTFKIPDNNNLYITQKCGGSSIDDVIKRAVRFYLKRRTIYVYTREEKKDVIE